MINLMIALQQMSENLPAINDSDILALKGGNTEALHTFYEKAHKSIYGFALSITKNKYDAEDVLQETVLSVYGNANNYIPSGKPMAWVLTIAKNLSLSKHRQNAKMASFTDGIAYADEMLDGIPDIESRIIIETAFKVLTDEERSIVTLKAVAGLKTREIAELMDIPLGSALSKYHRAIKKLEAQLKEA